MEEKGRIKRKVNFYWYYWAIISFFVFIFVDDVFPLIDTGELDLRLAISTISFLFGFLISISFSMIISRTNNLRDSLAVETGKIVSLLFLAKHIGSEFYKSVKENIDNYTVSTLRDYANYDRGRIYVYNIYELLEKVNPKGETSLKAYSSFTSVLNDWESVREKLEFLTSGKLIPAIRIANYLLGSMLIISLFLNRGSYLSGALFIFLSSIIVFILLIIEDYESLKIGDYINNISNSEQLFDLMEVNRYYPEEILGRVHLEKGRSYRIGIYDPESKSEKIFVLNYNRGFKQKLDELLNKLWNTKR